MRVVTITSSVPGLSRDLCEDFKDLIHESEMLQNVVYSSNCSGYAYELCQSITSSYSAKLSDLLTRASLETVAYVGLITLGERLLEAVDNVFNDVTMLLCLRSREERALKDLESQPLINDVVIESYGLFEYEDNLAKMYFPREQLEIEERTVDSLQVGLGQLRARLDQFMMALNEI